MSEKRNVDSSEFLWSELTDDTPTDSEASVATLADQNGEKYYEKEMADRILLIKAGADEMKTELMAIDSEKARNDFKKYEEYFLAKTIELDEMDAKGSEYLKELRKEAILFLQECLKYLDAMVSTTENTKT